MKLPSMAEPEAAERPRLFERRALVRQRCNLKSAGRQLADQQGEFWPARVQDISRSGLGLVTKQGFRRGTILVVQLQGRLPRFQRPVLVRVAHSRQVAGSEWQVGCSFSTRLTPEELEDLLAPPAEGAWGAEGGRDPLVVNTGKEMRTSSRRVGADVSVIVTRTEKSATPFDCWIIDRSAGGLCLSSPVQLTTNTLLKVRVTNVAATVPWVQVRVRYCRAEGKRYAVGCQFVGRPSYDTLLLFG